MLWNARNVLVEINTKTPSLDLHLLNVLPSGRYVLHFIEFRGGARGSGAPFFGRPDLSLLIILLIFD